MPPPASLSDPDAIERLHHRIEHAAKAICRYNGPQTSRLVAEKIHYCRKKTEQEALTRLGLTN